MSSHCVTVVAHADWSAHPKKRWMARAVLESGSRYRALPPEMVADARHLLGRLREEAGRHTAVLVGFDFPIGLPRAYAERARIDYFQSFLSELGRGQWPEFEHVALEPGQISLRRPFYPAKPGGSRRAYLVSGLRVASFDDLRRECERPHAGRRAACPLFWTMGGQQVGKAALSGWREVLIPALDGRTEGRRASAADSSCAIWPFAGRLEDLLRPGQTVVAETYPAEFYERLGVQFSSSQRGAKSGKRSPADRAANSEALLSWAAAGQVILDPPLEAAIRAGFGTAPAGEDPFDATVGLFGLLDVILNKPFPGEPEDGRIRKIEGWILGQRYP